MANDVIYKDLIAFHPGSYIEDIVEELNITQNEFADRLGTSNKTVSKIINGEERISTDIADKLAKLTGIPIKTWLDLQATYDIKKLEIENLRNYDEENICKMIDFSYFKKNNLIKDKRYSTKEKIEELRKLLNVASLSTLHEFNPNVSYRNTIDFNEKSIINSNIMLELASNKARNETNIKYSKNKLIKILPKIKEMTLQEPKVFYPELKKLLLECGIVLIGLPKLTNANLNGATKKFKNGSVMLLITDRNKKSDIFWFSLAHELGHIYYNDFYSNYEDIETYEYKEDRANKFAKNLFIPDDKYTKFVEEEKLDKKSILGFSEELEIHPSILVGRLQNDEYINYRTHAELRSRYDIIIQPND